MRPRGRGIGALALAALTLASAAPAYGADPTKDECITADESAQTFQQGGKLRAAKKQLLVCVARTCPAPVVEDCTQLLATVEKAMPTLVFAATDPDSNDLSAVLVRVDGEVLAGKLDGSPISVDPGEHVFNFESAGLAPIEKRLVVRVTEKERLVRISFTHIPGSGPKVTTTPGPLPTEVSGTGSSRWPAYVAFGAGGAGLVVGTVFGVMALSTKSSLDSPTGCRNGTSGCPAQEVSDLSTRAWVANGGFAVALVGAALCMILVLTSSGHDAKHGASMQVRVGLGSIAIGGPLP